MGHREMLIKSKIPTQRSMLKNNAYHSLGVWEWLGTFESKNVTFEYSLPLRDLFRTYPMKRPKYFGSFSSLSYSLVDFREG
jgi:hypothetical protein